jgi:hypothetical protein
MSAPAHGTVSGYVNLRCRQQCCRDAMAAYRRQRRVEFASQSLPPYVQHGTTNASQNYGCRCLACREANAANLRRYRDRRAAS